jgi:hypothetical protein
VLEQLPRENSIAICGSFALHSYLRHLASSSSSSSTASFSAPAWLPADIDVFLAQDIKAPPNTLSTNIITFLQQVLDFLETLLFHFVGVISY